MLKKISKDTKRGLKNSVYLTIANILIQIITLVGFVYIPNKLGVHDFGLYSTALSFVSLFYIFGFEGIAKVIIREKIKNQDVINNLFNNLFNFKLLIAIFQVIVIIVVALLIPKYNIGLFVLIVIASNEALFRGLKTIPSALLQADERIKTLSYINVSHSLIRITGMILVLYVFNDLFYMMSYIALVNILFLIIFYKSINDGHLSALSVNLRQIKIPMKLFKQGLVFSLIGVGSMLSTKIDVFMLSLMGEISDVGIYSLSEKVVLQFEMLRSVLMTAFYPIVVQHIHNKKVTLNTIYMSTFIIFILTLIISIGYYFFADVIIGFLFNDDYFKAAKVSSILCFYLTFYFSTLPISIVMQSVNLEKYILLMYLFSIIINIALNYYLYHSMGMIGLAYSTLIVHGFLLIYLLRIGSVQLRKKGLLA